MKGTVIVVVVCFSAIQGFVLDSLNGHHGPHGGPCTSDVDCSNGCCVNMKSPLGLFSHMECRPYHLPGAACDTASTGKGLDCGCMPGYTCQGDNLGNIAVEPNTHLKGSCMPSSGGSATGPQIAVEGGR